MTVAAFSEQSPAPTKQMSSDEQQLNYLNQQIEDLEDERDKFIAKAARARDQGDRLQFEQGMLTDARRYWKLADTCDEIAKKIDQQIVVLKKQRDTLQKKVNKNAN